MRLRTAAEAAALGRRVAKPVAYRDNAFDVPSPVGDLAAEAVVSGAPSVVTMPSLTVTVNLLWSHKSVLRIRSGGAAG
jgi:hypothetical protein